MTAPAALLISHYWSEIKFKKYYFSVSILLYLIILPAFYSGLVDDIIRSNSDKEMVKNKIVSDYSLLYLNHKSFSSQFYSLGSIKKIDFDQLKQKIENREKFAVIIEKSEIKKIDLFAIKKLTKLKENNKKVLYVYDF
tara:strand:- start:221 stop:634 length:414 start_codon:yes stop_codon:yes gene_type:complete